MPITLQPHDFTINALGGVLDSRNPAGVQPNRSPVIATIPDQTRAMGSTFSLASYFSDPDGDALTCTRIGGTAPAGVTVSAAGTVAVSMAVPAGSYTVGVNIADGRGGVASATFNLSVFLGAPVNLAATAISSSSIGLTWNAVSGATYKVYRNGTLVGSSATASYTDVGLAASTLYTYTVSAVIGASESAQSSNAGATTQAVSGGTFTITGSGFGTRSSLTPLFHRFFAPGEIVDGNSASSIGYSVGGTVTCDADTGYVPGYGCLSHTTTLGANDSFPHLYWVPNTPQRVAFQSYVYRLTRLAGSSSGTFQMKGPRTSYSTEYTGTPRVTSSFYHSLAADALSHTNMAYFHPAEQGTDDFGVSSTYKSRFRANNWNTVEHWTDWGTVGASDGFERIWYNGAQVGPFSAAPYNSEALAVRASSAELIEYFSLFPGLDYWGQTTSQWKLEIAEHYADNTPARVVVGNSPTWANCTHKQIMIPTAWSNTSVTASWRPLGFATSGQTVYGYVVNSSGTVSSATALTVP